jgi:NADPH:quinone reductase-like Zn-dependent oxidoreductase
MKAVIYTHYGSPDVMRIEEIEKPAPAANEVLIKVQASSINAVDYRPRNGKPFPLRFMLGFPKPKNTRLGADLAGRVEAIGENVKQFKVGDAVFGCRNGAFAEYVCVPEDRLALKPANISFEQAAAVPVGAITALQGLRDAGEIRSGQQVLIQGASGSVGIFAVQLAKFFGAEVTAVCSTKNLDMVRSIGADHVIDYTRENFTRRPQRYDLILAVNGQHSISDYKRALKPQGIFVIAGGALSQFFQVMLLGRWLSKSGGQQVRNMGMAQVNHTDLVILADLLKDGKIKPVIDRCYPLAEIVPAFRYVEDIHAQGKVVISIA